MKGSTSSGKREVFGGSNHSSNADSVDKWGHENYDKIVKEDKESEKAQTLKRNE